MKGDISYHSIKIHFKDRPFDVAKFIGRANAKGLVYMHAVLKVKQQDGFSVEPCEAKETFPSLALALLKEAGDSDGTEEWARRVFDLKPDLFSLNFERHEIAAHEIEDHHPLEPEKLERYVSAFKYCDGESVIFRLFVYDRYGLNRREIDLSLLSVSVGPFF